MMGGIGHLVDSGPLLLAMPVALAAGAVTFLSPCCLPLVPGYLSYLTGMSGTAARAPEAAAAGAAATPVAAQAAGAGGATLTVPVASAPAAAHAAASAAAGSGLAVPAKGRAVLGTLLFVLGFSVVFAIEALALSTAALTLRHDEQVLTRILGAVIIALGLMFVGAFDRFSFSGRIFRPQFRPRAGLAGAPLLGVVFGLGWTPCIGPTLAAVLTLGVTTGSSGRAVVLAFVYALGLGIPFLLVAAAFQRGVAVFGFFRRHGRLITQIGGALLIAVGVLEVTGAWGSAVVWLQAHWLAGYNAPI
ncbi:MAG TPA: cytochrome c biogenesis protein CcdA [Streptosporangiaceae bacterium]|jgi:cytochrome c-type biogenesis protein